MRAYWIILGFTVFFAVEFVYNLIHFRDPWLITGTAWALAAVCYIAGGLVREGPARIRPAETCRHFLRREFEGKRRSYLWVRWLAALLVSATVASWRGGGPALRAKTLPGCCSSLPDPGR